jgi:hypothetical protein
VLDRLYTAEIATFADLYAEREAQAARALKSGARSIAARRDDIPRGGLALCDLSEVP